MQLTDETSVITNTEEKRQSPVAHHQSLPREISKAAPPSEPCEVGVSVVLQAYIASTLRRAGAGKVSSPERIDYAVAPLTKFFGRQQCSSISDETCYEYRRWRNRSDGTVRRELGVLRAALNLAHRNGRISRQVPVELPDSPPAKDRWLTRSEAAGLIRAARRLTKGRDHLPTFILMALYSGKRKEAILSLLWPQVDLDAGIIDWERPSALRTNKRRGRNPVNPKLLRHLRRIRKYGSDDGPVVTYRGRPVKDVTRGFAAACEMAQLDGVTPHTLRHTCATWLMQKGVPTWQAAGFLGMTEETLSRVYGHHDPEFQKAAATAF